MSAIDWRFDGPPRDKVILVAVNNDTVWSYHLVRYVNSEDHFHWALIDDSRGDALVHFDYWTEINDPWEIVN